MGYTPCTHFLFLTVSLPLFLCLSLSFSLWDSLSLSLSLTPSLFWMVCDITVIAKYKLYSAKPHCSGTRWNVHKNNLEVRKFNLSSKIHDSLTINLLFVLLIHSKSAWECVHCVYIFVGPGKTAGSVYIWQTWIIGTDMKDYGPDIPFFLQEMRTTFNIRLE